ncbi:MAG: hypothetical protein HY650_16420 [Acidobacteria bacterium]|nr:hypothetical protein [Acidobacteriota bacterium]
MIILRLEINHQVDGFQGAWKDEYLRRGRIAGDARKDEGGELRPGRWRGRLIELQLRSLALFKLKFISQLPLPIPLLGQLLPQPALGLLPSLPLGFEPGKPILQAPPVQGQPSARRQGDQRGRGVGVSQDGSAKPPPWRIRSPSPVPRRPALHLPSQFSERPQLLPGVSDTFAASRPREQTALKGFKIRRKQLATQIFVDEVHLDRGDPLRELVVGEKAFLNLFQFLLGQEPEQVADQPPVIVLGVVHDW